MWTFLPNDLVPFLLPRLSMEVVIISYPLALASNKVALLWKTVWYSISRESLLQNHRNSSHKKLKALVYLQKRHLQ